MYGILVGHTLLWDILVGHSCGDSCRTLWRTLVGHSKSTVTSPDRAFRARRPQKLSRQVTKTSVSRETSSKSHASTSSKTPSKQHPLTRQSQCHRDIHLHRNSQPHDSLHLPRQSHFHTSKPAQSTAPAAKSDNISYHVRFNKIYTTPHVWNDFDTF